MKVRGEVNNVHDFCTSPGGSPNAVIHVAEKELEDWTSVRLE